jgi:hypothetical protein
MWSFVPAMTGREPATGTAGGADAEDTNQCSLSGSAPSAVNPLALAESSGDPRLTHDLCIGDLI